MLEPYFPSTAGGLNDQADPVSFSAVNPAVVMVYKKSFQDISPGRWDIDGLKKRISKIFFALFVTLIFCFGSSRSCMSGMAIGSDGWIDGMPRVFVLILGVEVSPWDIVRSVFRYKSRCISARGLRPSTAFEPERVG